MRHLRRVAASSMLLVLAACVLAPSTARAQQPDAKSLFAKGRKLREQGDCAAAVPVFEAALQAWPEGLGSLRNLAECQQELGKPASARRSWWDLRRAALMSKESKYQGWAEHAEKQHAALAADVARLIVVVRGAEPDSVRVSVDDVTLPPKLLGQELERDPGQAAIVARDDGGNELATETATLAKGQRERVVLTVAAAKRPQSQAPALAAPTQPRAAARPDDGADDSTDDSATLATAGYVLIGLGGVAAIGTIASVAVRQSALSDVERDCPAYESGINCPASLSDAVDRGETASLLVNVFAPIAGASLGVGAALLIADAVGRPAPATVSVVPLSGGALWTVEARF